MKRRIIFGASVVTLAMTLTAPAMADDDMRSLRYILNMVSQFDRGHGHFHHAGRYQDDDDRRHGFHHHRYSRDDDDDDDDRERRGGRRGGWDDDDD